MAINAKDNFDELINRLEEQNRVADKLNREAEAARARKKLLTEQFLDGVALVEKATGKKIKQENIEKTLAEVTAVADELQKKIEKELDKQLKLIKLVESGEFEKAAKLAEVDDGDSAIEKDTVSEDEEVFETVEDVVDSFEEDETNVEPELGFEEDEDDDSFHIIEDDSEDWGIVEDDEPGEEVEDYFNDDDMDFSSMLKGTKFSI